jgi:hypothetical protein
MRVATTQHVADSRDDNDAAAVPADADADADADAADVPTIRLSHIAETRWGREDGGHLFSQNAAIMEDDAA